MLKFTQEERQIQIEFLTSCRDNEIEKVKEYTEKYPTILEDDFNLGLITAGEKQNNSIVKYLLEEESIKDYIDIHFSYETQEDHLFIDSCKRNNLELVEYLSTSPALAEHSDIHVDNDKPLIESCKKGNIDIVRFLLTSPLLKKLKNPKINSDKGNAFVSACENDRQELIEYLTTSPELTEHSNLHARDDSGFKNLFIFPDLTTIQYLIFTLHIEKTKNITEYLNSFIDRANYLIQENKLNLTTKQSAKKAEDIFDFFEKRDMLVKLDNELPSKEHVTKAKKKI